ncbi:MAG: glycosyltransferase [Methanomassiliicoccus sp.]|jgi:cellulose synthase/poly-beta-1,6-N-acetylglucosamine synthase-like glycosyltransferase|nr:glycosyltransferase [Methanomassiliicoccus sp.]
MASVSVGVCAYNEEKNILSSLRSLMGQREEGFSLKDIVVVSSGSTDRTDDMVLEVSRSDERIRLLRQERREGKNSAVNLFLSQAQGDVCVLVNADNTLEPDSLTKLLAPFSDLTVGMAGGRPVPTNDKGTVSGFAVHMLWDMHHRLSLLYPKVGELVAFRNLGITLPTTMQSDEDIMRMELEKKGLRTVYVPEAIVHNKGPTTVRDFLKQRTRVNIGEQYMKRIYDYDIPTWNPRWLFQSYLGFLRDNSRELPRTIAAMSLEAYARIYAMLYVKMDRGDKAVWSQVSSTKDVGK